MNAYVGLFFDVVTLAALAAVIFYSLRLSKQFNDLRADRRAFEQLIAALNVAASRAEGAIASLKEAARGSADLLQEKINAARTLADELEIMIHAGDNLADRLMKNAGARKAAPAEENEAPRGADQPRTRAERELIEALKAKNKS